MKTVPTFLTVLTISFSAIQLSGIAKTTDPRDTLSISLNLLTNIPGIHVGHS